MSALGTAFSASADIINVPGDQPTIQAGIDAAVNGDEVVLADGTYSGSGNCSVSFQGKLITVRSASGDPTTCTIESCSDVSNAVVFENGETLDAVLEGITITGDITTIPSFRAVRIQGSSPSISNCVFDGNYGAILILTGDPVITNCTLSSNGVVGSGGAVLVEGGLGRRRVGGSRSQPIRHRLQFRGKPLSI
jgi:parallel beta-helix repeat protein